jgi:predicted glycosyltransferase
MNTKNTRDSNTVLDARPRHTQEIAGKGRPARPKKIWIDLDNTPHIPFFAPIIDELQQRGYSVVLTARDCFQVCGLADLFQFRYTRIGRHYGKHKIMKALGTILRGLQLLPTARREKPDLAISHGSRSQLISASISGIPSVVIFDYEFVKHIPGVSPTWVMVPEMIPDSALNRKKDTVLRYPGIKEEVYVPRFKPDASIKGLLGLDSKALIVTIRPPANEAHYHNPESEKLFAAVLELLDNRPGTQIILLPRNEKQGAAVRKSWPDMFSSGKIIIPGQAVDGLSLIWYSDLVVSGGGTMNREAAALGVPVYSIFRGKIGAIDRYLADNGRMVLLESVEDVKSKIVLQQRHRPSSPESAGTMVLDKIISDVVKILGDAPPVSKRPPDTANGARPRTKESKMPKAGNQK